MNRNEEPLFRRACIQSGAVGTLGPITMAQADYNWEIFCQKLRLEEARVESRLEGLLALSTEALLQATRELRWYTFPLVEDKFAMAIEKEPDDHERLFTINLGDVDNNPSGSTSGNIGILIGDTEVEVRILFLS